MQRASAAFGLLIFVLCLAFLWLGLAYVTVWAATQRRPQWRIMSWIFSNESDPNSQPSAPTTTPKPKTAEVIPFDRKAIERRRKRA
jgi:hypothetical protein